jgi:peroxiredoxin
MPLTNAVRLQGASCGADEIGHGPLIGALFWRDKSAQLLRSHTMSIKVGDRLPEATLRTMTSEGPQAKTTGDIFAGKTVALFAVPGAFTPTCSARHLPGFLDLGKQLKSKGVDEIVCVSVNDVFVMDAWGKAQHVDGDILMLSDGNGEFTRAIGLELDGSKFGMGPRSQRYSLVAKDGVVTQLNVEAGGEFKVSAADYMLEKL